MSSYAVTPGQTVGPFFHLGLTFPGDAVLVAGDTAGARQLYGTVYDGAGETVPDALLELWQPRPDGSLPDAAGSFDRSGFTGWGRAATDAGGGYSFTTLSPGAPDGGVAFFSLTVFARGLLHRVQTRAYLPEPAATLASDPLLARLPADRRDTLVAAATNDGWRFDIRLQGDDETVFLEPPAVP